jgi:hypothetical protein
MSAKTVEKTISKEIASGSEIFVPLNRLKKSPKNARKTPHGEAAIEALAASPLRGCSKIWWSSRSSTPMGWRPAIIW